MRIGIVSDVHDAIEPLRRALASLRENAAERIVSLGDAFDSCAPGEPGVEVGRLLREAGAIGVWGNHDVGLTHEVTDAIRGLADPELLAYVAGFRGSLLLEGCRFSHIMPWLDAEKFEDLWSFPNLQGFSDGDGKRFPGSDWSVAFAGHLHAWLAMSQREVLPWDGDRPLRLEPGLRHIIVIAAVVDGWCAVFDTERRTLEPLRCL